MKEFAPIKEGKVREIYDNGDSLIMVATNRISAFDVILKNKVTKKGAVLTQMSKFWFDYTKDIVPNHMISTDVNDMPEYFRKPEFTGNSMLCRKLNMIPIECIVRGYITGSGWVSYQKNGTVCGIKLPAGLKECDQLPEPIYTPSTKAEIGDHAYCVSEDDASTKYFLAVDEHFQVAEIPDEEEEHNIVVTDNHIQYQLAKVDENGTPVKDARLLITDVTDTLDQERTVLDWRSTEEPLIINLFERGHA